MLFGDLKQERGRVAFSLAFAFVSNSNPSVCGTFAFQFLFDRRKPLLKQKATRGRAVSSVNDRQPARSPFGSFKILKLFIYLVYQ